MGEKRLIHACAKAAILTNRDGSREKPFGFRLPKYTIRLSCMEGDSLQPSWAAGDGADGMPIARLL